MSEESKLAWAKEGLKFKCTGCGKCCTGSPGYVFLSPIDVEKLAAHMQLSIPEFLRKYTRLVHQVHVLLDAPGTDRCIFLKNKLCTVYPARPSQCTTYPWWIQNLESKEAWEEEGKRCEGINHPDAPLIKIEEIKKSIS